MKNLLEKCNWFLLFTMLTTSVEPVFAVRYMKSAPNLVQESAISLVYLSIYVKVKGKKEKQFKTPEIKGSKSRIQREVKAYIEKYVPELSDAQCRISLVQTKISKTTAGTQKSKSVSGDGLTIHKNMSSVLSRLM